MGFKKLCFDSMVVQKNFCCEKNANKLTIKEKMRNYPPYQERYSEQGGLWKIWSFKELHFKVDDKQRETIFCTVGNFIVYQRKYVAVITKNIDKAMYNCPDKRKLYIWKFIFRGKNVCFKACEHNGVGFH